MPSIIDYERVLARMEGDGFRTLYHNGGAFGFPRGAEVNYVGWVGLPDESIRPEALARVRQIAPPYEANLARAAGRVWSDQLPGVAWVMPMSHWSYELEFGSREWMPAALAAAGVDASPLSARANAAAIEFDLNERDALEGFVAQLLAHLRTSDFVLAFPGRAALCTVHHHKQLWWQTTDTALHAVLSSA